MRERVNMLWVGSALSPVEQLSISSFLQNRHEVHLYIYDDVKNIPQGTIIEDGNTIIPRDKVFKHMNSYAAFADLFRWKLMSLGLGYWSDTDVICLKHFNLEENVIIGKQYREGQGREPFTPTILKSTVTNNKLVNDMYEIAENPLRVLPYNTAREKRKKFKKRLLQAIGLQKTYAIGWGETAGPFALTRYYEYNKDICGDVRILEPEIWYPVPWQDWDKFSKPNGLEIEELPEESLAVHLWNEMWFRNGVDKWKPFSKDSFMGKLLRHYGLD